MSKLPINLRALITSLLSLVKIEMLHLVFQMKAINLGERKAASVEVEPKMKALLERYATLFQKGLPPHPQS